MILAPSALTCSHGMPCIEGRRALFDDDEDEDEHENENEDDDDETVDTDGDYVIFLRM